MVMTLWLLKKSKCPPPPYDTALTSVFVLELSNESDWIQPQLLRELRFLYVPEQVLCGVDIIRSTYKTLFTGLIGICTPNNRENEK